MIAALVAMLIAEHVAAPVARARVEAVVEACEAAAGSDSFLARLCVVNAYRESRMDPSRVGDRGQARGAWQIHNRRAVPLDVGAAMFVASVRRHRGPRCDDVCALATHMSGVRGGTPVSRRKAMARVRWARRLATP